MQDGSQGYAIREKAYDAKIWERACLIFEAWHEEEPKNSNVKHKGYPFYAEVQANLDKWQLYTSKLE